MDELTCRELIEFLMDYLEGALPSRQRSAFDAHLAACEPCRNYLKTYEKSVELARQSLCEEGELPEELVAGIVSALKRV